MMPPLPAVLGLEGAGVVEDVEMKSPHPKRQRVSFIAPGSMPKESRLIPPRAHPSPGRNRF